MELDFSDLKFEQTGMLWITLGVIVALLLFGVLGWYITPQGQVLSWTEWQVYRQHNQYRNELRVLTHHADRLAELMNKPPDPVRAQLVTEQMVRDLEQNVTLVALQDQEAALFYAGDAIMAWAMGTASKNEAINALDQANQTIERAFEQFRGDR